MTNVLVLLATFNGENFLREQIDSVLNQSCVDIRLIVADDASSDQTCVILTEEYNFPNIELSKNLPGTGSAANNFLTMVSRLNFEEKFDYVAFSDQDDIWLPSKMEVATLSLDKNNADLYCSNLTKWDTSNNSYSLLKKDFPQKKFDFLFEGGSAGCTYVFTRDFAKQLQFFLTAVDTTNWKAFSHDWLVYFFARSKNFKVVIDSNSYIHYRIHNANVHGHLNQMSIATIKHKSAEVFNGYYQNHLVNYIKYLDQNSEAYSICKKFLGNYFQRNYVIWKYNLQLMRDNKKFLIFAGLNLLKFQ